MNFERTALLVAMALALTSCGGGDSGSGTGSTPPTANQAPQFSSASAVSVLENSSGPFYRATANDSDGDPVSFSITGGADAGLFRLDGADLSFTSTPNFDRFADADRNNVFDIRLRASDSRGGSVEQSISITVGNSIEGVSVRRIVTGLDNPVAITGFIEGVVGDDFLLVGERDGTIWSVNGATGERTVYRELNLAPGRELLDVAGFGAGGIVLRPVALVRDRSGIYLIPSLDSAPIAEIRIADGDPQGAAATLAYTWNTELGGQGLLVIAIGDPGGQRAQGTSGYGKVFILRDPSGATTSDELFEVGRGLQQPSRIFDFVKGVLIADVGQTAQHELSPLTSRSSVNFGWPFSEGTTAIRSGAPTPLVAPSFTYSRGTDVFSGSAIRGGVYYDSQDPFERSRIASLEDRVVFADANGSIFTVNLDFASTSFENRTLDFAPNAGALNNIVAMAEEFDRILFILDADGEVFRVDPA